MINKEEIQIKEQQLEEASKKAEEYIARKNLPVYEVFITVFSLMLSVLLFWFPTMLDVTVISDGKVSQVYGLLLAIAPKWVYGVGFFTAAIIKALGLLLSINSLRMIGLWLSVVLYVMFTICLIANFPSILLIIFFNMTIFTIFSIPLVKRTSISTKPQSEVLDIEGN